MSGAKNCNASCNDPFFLKLRRSLFECYLVEGACNIAENLSGIFFLKPQGNSCWKWSQEVSVQLTAQNRVRYRERTSCSRQCPVRSWKPLGTETAASLGSLWCVYAHGRNFPYTRTGPLILSHVCCLLSWLCLLVNLSTGAGRLLLRPLKISSSPGCTSPIPSYEMCLLLPSKGMVALYWTHSSLLVTVLYWGP